MKIKTKHKEISIIKRKLTASLILTRKDGEKRELFIEKFIIDDDVTGFDDIETYYHEGKKIENLEEFIKDFDPKADAKEVIDDINYIIYNE